MLLMKLSSITFHCLIHTNNSIINFVFKVLINISINEESIDGKSDDKDYDMNEDFSDSNYSSISVRSIDRKSVDTNHTFINNHLSLNDSEESDNSCQIIVDENEDKIEDNFNNNKTRVWFKKLNKQEIGAKLRDNDYEIESVSNNQWISGLIH